MKWNKNILLIVLVVALLPQIVIAQRDTKGYLRRKIQTIIDTVGGKVGVAIMDIELGDSLVISGDGHFPMQSVFKFPLAIAILDKVDKGQLSLTQHVLIGKQQLDTNTWSPLVKDFPDQDIDITLIELLRYTVSKSDNNGCDGLFRLYGGTKAVNYYIRSLGIKGINIAATEREMAGAWPIQYTNWCKPGTMLQLLNLFYKGKLLSRTSTDLLMRLMTESENSPNRIKGMLPANTAVAHKTGTSGTNEHGMKAGTNDVGIITLPDGRHFALVVFVSDYKGGVNRGEHIIAEIAKVAWDTFTKR